MPTNLQDLCETFSKELLAQYALVAERGIQPGEYDWLNTALIFVALENCRGHCVNALEQPSPSESLYCRYTLGSLDDEDHNDIRHLLDQLRGTNPTLKELPNRLRMFLFDFSISTLALNEGYAPDGIDVPVPFRFLLIAESELRTQKREVTKDLLRLVVANCPLKVMIYRAWGVDLREAFTNVLERCGPAGHHSSAGWLFVGVPTYSDWYAANLSDEDLQVWIHCLEAGSESIELETHPDWWKG